jgi:hypothetical protein
MSGDNQFERLAVNFDIQLLDAGTLAYKSCRSCRVAASFGHIHIEASRPTHSISVFNMCGIFFISCSFLLKGWKRVVLFGMGAFLLSTKVLESSLQISTI